MRNIKHLSVAIALIALSLIVGVSKARADSSTPVNYISTNFSPVTTSVSYNYDFTSGTLTEGTATATVFSTNNLVRSKVSDPSPPSSPNGFGTFIGTAKPVKFLGEQGTVLYEQSVCPVYPTCFSDGTFSFGDMVLYNARGLTLDQLTNLQALWVASSGSDGGGSPRFQIAMSNGGNINVYFGHYPSFAGEAPTTWTPACPTDQCGPTNNMASDSAGLRWDSTQIGGLFYGTYSEAVTLANAQGLTINAIVVITDGGWFGANAGNSNGQTFLFQQIQVNGVTRFP